MWPSDLEQGMAGSLPYLAAGSGMPLVYLGGLVPRAGVESITARCMALGAVAPFAQRRRVTFFNRRPGMRLRDTDASA